MGAPRAALVAVVAVVVLLPAACAKPVDEREVPETGPTRSAAPTRAARPAPKPPPTPTGTPRVTAVSPVALERGAFPRVPWYDPDTTVLHDGRRAVRTGLRDGRDLWVAGDSYLLTTGTGDAVTLHRVARDGRSEVLALEVDRSLAVSGDGRTVAYSRTTDRSQAVVVARAADGAVVAQTTYAAGPDTTGQAVVAVAGDRLLLSRPGRTWWWSFRDGSEQTVARGEAAAVSVPHDRLAHALDEGADTWAVGPLDGVRDRWSTPRHVVPLAFSPGGTWLVSGSSRPVGDVLGPERRPLLVSGARGGGPVRLLDGAFGNTDVVEPRWESDGVLLALAGESRSPAAGHATVTWVRCRVQGGCEAASPGFRFDTDGSFGGLWVLAHQQ